MQNLSLDQIVANIEQGICFEATYEGDFEVKIQEYAPFVCTAIHDGHRLRDELKEHCLLSESERLYEEDPYTADFIRSLPITLIGCDSRYEYDLNRDEENCFYDVAWGKKVWKDSLPADAKERSLQKHRNFYRIVEALVTKLEKEFKAAIVYDIHSYNHLRHDKTYLFNIGIENIDVKRYNSEISFWKKELLGTQIKKHISEVSVNHLFYGRGYLLKFVKDKFSYTLVLATEVKKVFMNELTGEVYPLVVQSIAKNFKHCIINNSQHYINRLSNYNVKKKSSLLGGLQPELVKIDKELYRIARNFEILGYVNPINIEQEKKKFFKSDFTVNPDFRYKQLRLDPHAFKAKMYQLDVDSIEDVHVRQIYVDIIKAYSDKVEMLSTIGTSKFLYNSLRYFGEPSTKDLANANFLLYCQELPQFEAETVMSQEEVKKAFIDEGEKYGFEFKVDIDPNIPSDAVVINSKQKILLKKGAVFTPSRISALLNHEIGVHMVTTKNAQLQPLKMLSLGLPKNTFTQEGLAIMSELKSGCLTISRLKELALRVLAVHSLTQGNDFKTTFTQLKASKAIKDDKLYYLVARVYRGGGFTKDFLYLSGFRRILKLESSGVNLDNLFLGKTSESYLSLLNELVDRGYLTAPKYKCESFQHPQPYDTILQYLTNSLQ